MKVQEAKAELAHALENQKTISIPRLKRLLELSYVKEVQFYRRKNRSLYGQVKRQRRNLRLLNEKLDGMKKRGIL